jgi:signal transduction histidine kinase
MDGISRGAMLGAAVAVGVALLVGVALTPVETGEALAVLLVVPVAMVACELGVWAGLAAGAVAIAARVGVAAAAGVEIDALACVADGVAYLAMGAGLGIKSQGLHGVQRDLRRSNAELEHLAAVASHDLRAPLATVSGFAELLQAREAGRLDDRGRQMLQYVRHGVDDAREVIDDLLMSAGPDAGLRAPERVDCAALAQRAVDDVLGPERERAQIEIGILPVVQGNPVQLRRVFANLISNALKHSQSDAPFVRVLAERDGRAWRMEVIDNGVGVPSVDRERIFGMYERGPADATAAGEGIGLAASRRIVELHGGRLWTEPAVGGGSVFAFTVPDAS